METRDLTIRGDMIRLGQLLKFSGVAHSGDEAKAILAEGIVSVNGEPESRRGRQLRNGDTVIIGDERLRVVSAGPS